MSGDRVKKTGRYREPPFHSRFTKGTSGNPNGRPKGRKSLRASFEAILAQKIKVREGNKVRVISKADALFSMLVNAGLKGDVGTGLKAVALASRVEEGAAKEAHRSKRKFDDLTNDEVLQLVVDRKISTEALLRFMSDDHLQETLDWVEEEIKKA
jgi:hypothetical protein